MTIPIEIYTGNPNPKEKRKDIPASIDTGFKELKSKDSVAGAEI